MQEPAARPKAANLGNLMALLLLLLDMVSSSPAAAECTTAASCSLLGRCIGGRCQCDPGWTSHNCSVLDLSPAPMPAQQAYMTNRSSWGGNAIKHPVTGEYHLFFSEMRVGGLHSYSLPGHCQLTTAVSPSSPLGPYTQRRTVLRSSAVGGPTRGTISHNVQPQMGPDGAVYIFMITSNPQPPLNISSSAPSPTLGSGGGKNLSVMVGRAPQLGADFEWVTPRLLQPNGTQILKDNPSAIVYRLRVNRHLD